MKNSAQRLQAALEEMGLSPIIKELEESTKTAELAAQALGCDVSQIVKSLLFKTKKTKKPVMVVASGANRVNLERVKELVSEPIRMADPEFVREHTGYAIGGVAPLGHLTEFPIYIDEDLMRQNEIWAAAGTPSSMFCLTPSDLKAITRGQVVSIK